MSLFDFFFPKKPNSAAVAKERLQIVLAHERASRDGPDFLPILQRELVGVVGKYIPVREDQIRVHIGRAGNASVLEINIEIPSAPKERGGGGLRAAAFAR